MLRLLTVLTFILLTLSQSQNCLASNIIGINLDNTFAMSHNTDISSDFGLIFLPVTYKGFNLGLSADYFQSSFDKFTPEETVSTPKSSFHEYSIGLVAQYYSESLYEIRIGLSNLDYDHKNDHASVKWEGWGITSKLSYLSKDSFLKCLSLKYTQTFNSEANSFSINPYFELKEEDYLNFHHVTLTGEFNLINFKFNDNKYSIVSSLSGFRSNQTEGGSIGLGVFLNHSNDGMGSYGINFKAYKRSDTKIIPAIEILINIDRMEI